MMMRRSSNSHDYTYGKESRRNRSRVNTGSSHKPHEEEKRIYHQNQNKKELVKTKMMRYRTQKG